MPALANPLILLLQGLFFVAYACAMGGLVWSVFLYRPWGQGRLAEQSFLLQSLALLRWGALGMVLAQLARMTVQAWLVAEAFQRSPLPVYLQTLPFQAGLIRALLAGGLAAVGHWLAQRPKTLFPWTMAGCLAILLGASGAWLSHAVARDQERLFPMGLTALHQLAMAVWLGGVIQLGMLWRLIRHQPDKRPLWPALLGRFAWVAGPAVLALMASGLGLAWMYIGTWQGLIGTDYGVMALIKVLLFLGALGLAMLNFLGARHVTSRHRCPRPASHLVGSG